MDLLHKLRNLWTGLEAPPLPARPSYYSCSTCKDTGEVTRLSDGSKMPCPMCMGSIYDGLDEP